MKLTAKANQAKIDEAERDKVRAKRRKAHADWVKVKIEWRNKHDGYLWRRVDV